MCTVLCIWRPIIFIMPAQSPRDINKSLCSRSKIALVLPTAVGFHSYQLKWVRSKKTCEADCNVFVVFIRVEIVSLLRWLRKNNHSRDFGSRVRSIFNLFASNLIGEFYKVLYLEIMVLFAMGLIDFIVEEVWKVVRHFKVFGWGILELDGFFCQLFLLKMSFKRDEIAKDSVFVTYVLSVLIAHIVILLISFGIWPIHGYIRLRLTRLL